MNCAECRENLVACAEGLLDGETALKCREHLEACAACQAEYQAIVGLQQRLIAHGQASVGVSLVEPVMGRIRRAQRKPEGETIMSKILKHRWGFGLGATAAAVAIAATIVVTMSPKAFGIQQVIEAYKHVHYLQVKTFPSNHRQTPNEFWIEANDQGRVKKARYYLPKTEDGPKLITWTPEKSEIWFKRKHSFGIFRTKKIAPWMQGLLDQSQPQLYMEGLLEQQEAGKVKLQFQKNGGSEVVVATNRDGQKQVISIDNKTDLITSIVWYHMKGTNEVFRMRTEFSDYNVPIAEEMFSLQDQLPPDVIVFDQLNQVVGVAQGNMTDEQAAAETVRQFFQALIDKDYKKAGLIYCGELEKYAKKEFGTVNIAKIISVGPAVAQTNWVKHGFRVPCKLEIVQPDGQKTICTSSPYVRPGDDEMHPDHWNISGGVDFEVKILPDNEKYAAMTAEQAARTFFEACSREDWNEAGKFISPVNERFEQYYGGLKLISVGKSFTSENYPGGLAFKGYPGRFVPYVIKLKNGDVKKWYLALRKDNLADRWQVDGGI